MQSEKQIAVAQGVLGRGGVYVGAELVRSALEAALSAAEPLGVRCTGCGSLWDNERLAKEREKRPELISCCPERKLEPVWYQNIKGMLRGLSFTDEMKMACLREFEVFYKSAITAQVQDVAETPLQAIADERKRQISKGYDSAHDDTHVAGDIISSSWGALSRIYVAQDRGMAGDVEGYKKYLVQAAAQIVAECERVDRPAAPAKQEGGE